MMKKFLTLKEAADYMGLAENELERLTNEDAVPSYKIGGIYTRYRIDDLRTYGRKALRGVRHKYSVSLPDRIKDFFYFNDFYIISIAVIIVIIYFIFK
ncbi:MAG: helix-turn-helix domain-containing protein [Candidatus Omnitrophota bacterium]